MRIVNYIRTSFKRGFAKKINKVKAPRDESPHDESKYSRITISDSKYPNTKLFEYQNRFRIYLIGTSHSQATSRELVRKVIHEQKPSVIFTELGNKVLLQIEFFSSTSYTLSDIFSKFGFRGVLGKFYFDYMMKHENVNGGEFVVAFKESMKIPNCELKCIEPNYPKNISFFFYHLMWDLKNLLFHEDLSTKRGEAYLLLKEYLKQRKSQKPDPTKLEPYWHSMPQLYSALVSNRDKEMAERIVQFIDLYSFKIPSKKESKPPTANFVAVTGIGHTNGIIKFITKIFEERHKLNRVESPNPK